MAAVVACAPRGSGFEQDCSQCHDPEKRRLWGCDEPAAEPLAWINPCPFCGGRSDSCTHCSGTNRVPVHRCPNKLVTRAELDLITASALVENGVLPDAGGWTEQAALFTQAWPVVMQEINHWRDVRRSQAMKK